MPTHIAAIRVVLLTRPDDGSSEGAGLRLG
jgi:hypothetical protein